MRLKLVDGFKIRNTLDDDFAVLHTHGTEIGLPDKKFYIPEGEWWLDYRHKNERDFLMKVERINQPPNISTYDEFRKYLKKKICLEPPVPEFVISKKKSGGRNLAMIDGSVIRKYIDPEFVIGGHDLVYSYIPKNEIWIDAAIDPKEIPYIFLHEAVERDYMKKGKSYDVAHEYATAADKESRRKNGVGFYPFDGNYPWKKRGSKDIIKGYYA